MKDQDRTFYTVVVVDDETDEPFAVHQFQPGWIRSVAIDAFDDHGVSAGTYALLYEAVWDTVGPQVNLIRSKRTSEGQEHNYVTGQVVRCTTIADHTND